MPQAKRTLVKSGPELWAELTHPGALARHLSPLGSVRITRTTPETLVEWEGDLAAGTVRLEPSGFGTRVVLTAAPAGATAPASPAPAPVPEREAEAVRRSFLDRLLGRDARALDAPPAPEPAASGDEAIERVLADCLDALGSARHRPFSRV